jgi:hypothetical protein
MHEFMAWLENSMLGHAMRESGVWTYAVVNLTHILGVSTLFGSILALDLRLLGVWRKIPLAAVAEPTISIATVGFFIAATSGLGLLATKATEYVGNPFVYIKFPAIGLGLINIFALNYVPGWKERKVRDLSPKEQTRLAVAGGISLACWMTAMTAGRMIGYW